MNRLTITATLLAMALFTLACTSDDNEMPTVAPSTPLAPTIPMATQAPAPTPTPTKPTTASTLIPCSERPPSPLPRIMSHTIDVLPIPSLDRQVFSSHVIALSEFATVAAGSEQINSSKCEAPTHRPTLTLTFRAVEYLKGTGPEIFNVELRDIGGTEYWENGERYNGYLTQARALAEAQRLVSQRNTVYDNRPGVLFLKGPVEPQSATISAEDGISALADDTFNFLLYNAAVQGSFVVDIDSLSRTWFPVQTIRDAEKLDPSLVTNRPVPREHRRLQPSEDPFVMSLSTLKTRIGEIVAMIAAGDGTAAYSDCVLQKLTRHEYFRSRTTPAKVGEYALTSGQPAGTEIYRSSLVDGAAYNVYTTSGPDAAQFTHTTEDEDSFASNGYRFIEATARPLPAGKYAVKFHIQHYKGVICDHNPIHNNYSAYNVTVTAPAGTLHEAFFDPVTIGTAVGADATNGVLKPASFTVGETAAQITGLKWENNQAVLTLNPHASLANYALDFIALDGSVSLTLNAKDATVDATAGTYTWSVTPQPWHEGDKLMLRIREDATPPNTPIQ